MDYVNLLSTIREQEIGSFANETKKLIRLGYIPKEEIWINVNFNVVEKEIKALQCSSKLTGECKKELDNLLKELEEGRKIDIIDDEVPFSLYSLLAYVEHRANEVAKHLNEL
ncbi:hypothetical protein M9Y10_037587 [Tritrichomonas musculus]|uniref:Uncharacterized protein n=1 Tax=Tritrichomonas musculus TaxID=1915356 RepID=A0ABR2GRX5_9EUKA